MAKKLNVPVYAIINNGKVTPVKFKWTDGKWYKIDHIYSCCNAASTKVGGCGIRYEIRVDSTVSYLFYEQEEENWFMETE